MNELSKGTRAALDERCICGDLEPAHARIHCPVHGLFAGLTREQLRDRCARLQQAIDALCSEPTHSGPPHDKAVRVISYRAIREHFAKADLDR